MDPEEEMPEPPVPLPVVVVGFIIWMYEGDLMVCPATDTEGRMRSPSCDEVP